MQFAAALLAAVEAGQVKDRRALELAARKLIADQSADGAWRIEPDGALGSPATWGTTLATAMAQKVLRQTNSSEAAVAIRRAEQWLSRATPNNVLTAAPLLIATANRTDDAAQQKRQACLNLLRGAQTHDGGWGPYPDAAPEPFDTAVALLALSDLRDQSGVEDLMRRGRAFLIAQQNDDGSWTETTRPAGGESYAQRMSTTGWATLALLATGK